MEGGASTTTDGTALPFCPEKSLFKTRSREKSKKRVGVRKKCQLYIFESKIMTIFVANIH